MPALLAKLRPHKLDDGLDIDIPHSCGPDFNMFLNKFMFHYIDYSIDYSIQFLFLCFAGCIIVSQNLRGRVAKIENK